jgi:Uma2 family endonuclease
VLRRAELVEGVLVVTPSPTGRHQRLGWRLCAALEAQLPAGLLAVPDVEVLTDPGPPPTVRRPDVVVLGPAADEDDHRFSPDAVVAVFEVLSPGSRRTDRIAKLADYADAGIAHYGIVEPGPSVALTEYVLGEGGYRLVAEHRHSAPLAVGVRLDLDALG